MLQVYPEKVAALPSQQLQTLLHTLEFGIASSEPEAVQSALEALAALAKFDYQSKQAGNPGLQAGAGIFCYCMWLVFTVVSILYFLQSPPCDIVVTFPTQAQKLCTMSHGTHSVTPSFTH